jgi:hypothetical protein
MILGVIVFLAIEDRFKRRATVGRSNLTGVQIYETYFKDFGYVKDDVLQLWYEIADALEIKAGLLRPQDRFGKDVGGGFVLTPELDLLTELAIERTERQGLTIDLEAIETVDDYVKMFARRQAQN